MPRPPAEFSPLATTRSGAWRSRSSGIASRQPAPARLADDVADEEDAASRRSLIAASVSGRSAATLAIRRASRRSRAVLEARGLRKSYGGRDGAARRRLRGAARASWSRASGRTAPARRRCSRSSPGSCSPTRARSAGRRARSAGCRSRRRSTGSSPWPRTCACSRASRGVADVEAAVERMLEQTGLARAPRRAGRRGSRAATSSGSTSRSACSRGPPVLLLDEPSAGLDPRQRERLWEFVVGLAGGGTTVIFSTHNVPEAERYGRPAAGARRRRGALRRHRGASCTRRSPARPGRRPRLRDGVRRLPAPAGALSADALAAAQGPADPAPLAAADGAAGRLPGRWSRC